MKRAIIWAIIVLFLADASMAIDKYYALDLDYYGGIITYRGINLLTGQAPDSVSEGQYKLRIVSFYNTALMESTFGINENKDFTLYIPYYNEAKEIVIFNGAERVFGYDVSSFADVCGDGTCQPQESFEDCPNDCRSGMKDDYCDGVGDGKCDPDCPVNLDSDCAEQPAQDEPIIDKPVEEKKLAVSGIEDRSVKVNVSNKSPILLYFFAFLSVILIIIGAVFFIKRRNLKNNDTKIISYIKENIARGYNKEQIKQVLLRYGYSPDEIDKLFNRI
ncbi:MAG: hypothetical protein KKC54_08935 [Nanoarchaeota archaeon]|nr:hypothetical protein [Nanoarchaeota archaeon]MBU1947063.1 hypothetical protein [Nanoarchaeota archaeon]